MKQIMRLTENDLKKTIKKIIQEVAMIGKSGKKYSLHGNDPEAWGIMADLRRGSYPFGNRKNEYNTVRDDENFLELTADADDKYIDRMETRIGRALSDLLENSKRKVNNKSTKQTIRLTESELKNVIKEAINEITGWASDPEDFKIVGGELDPQKTYMLICISSGPIFEKFVTEYDDYFPIMLNAIYNEFGSEYPEMFRPMEDYNSDVHEIMVSDGLDEETAESYANDVWVPVWDYDFAVYAPYGIRNSDPMSGAEMKANIEATAKDSWLRH